MNHVNFKQALIPTPFHEQMSELSQLNNWVSWNGYMVPGTLDQLAAEYYAVRSSCSVMDLTPMEKYRITGPDAHAFLNRLVTRNISKLKPGRVTYVVWCNDDGKVIDDGTIFYMREGEFRLCAAHHQLDWLLISAVGFDVTIEEETHDVAALAVQGPTSCQVLKFAGIEGLEKVKPFDILHTQMAGFDITISRTGYSGDLGYELWTDPANAAAMWDALFSVKQRGLLDVRPIGLDALGMIRIEAGFILPGDDFNTAETTVRAGHDRSPFELGLGWVVHFKKPHFTGKRALLEEKSRPPKRRIVKLSVEGNKEPQDSFLYDGKKGKKIGEIKAQLWSPILKSNLALADIEFQNGKLPANIWAEIYYDKELEWRAKWAKCTVSDKPFWSPERRNATPPFDF